MIDLCFIKPQHLSQIANLEKELFSDPWSENALESFLSSPWAMGIVCTENGSLLGYVLSTLVAGEGEILRIGVHPKMRRRGFGVKLISLCLENAKQQGANSFFLEVRKENTAAKNLYEKVGFFQVGTRKNYYSNPTEDAVLYQIQFNNKEPDL